MSDDTKTPPASTEPGADARDSDVPEKKSHPLRLLVLLVLLGLMLYALWHDRKVARPGRLAAFDRVVERNRAINEAAQFSSMTDKDVRDAIGRDASERFDWNDYQVEVYRWRGGLPWRTYDIYAVYVGDDRLMFVRHFLDRESMTRELEAKSSPENQPSDEPDGGGGNMGDNDFAPPDAELDEGRPRRPALEEEAPQNPPSSEDDSPAANDDSAADENDSREDR